MKPLLRFLLAVSAFAVLSCGFGPPKEMVADSFLDFAENTGDEIVDALNRFSAFDMMKPYWLPNPLLWHFSLNDEIHFVKTAFPSQTEDSSILFHLAEKGEILLCRDFYFTLLGNVLVYSFDRQRWFATDGDPREFEAFVPDIQLVSKRESQRLTFSFTWAIREGEKPKAVPVSDTVLLGSRKTVTLKPNQICYSTDRNDRAEDLQQAVFFVPKGTLVAFRWDVTSNFLSLKQTDETTTVLKPLKNLYFYRKNRFVALSFDGKDYGDTFFSYRFHMKQSVTTDASCFPTACQKIVLINKKYSY